ncbi:MAG: type II toxin-antitoxin system prevent-host-death family antitoxin [Peptococcaceae bacterium]|jgi:prevent-host-death family protein|nr:type II toxin-antitoxin system prevent-host-death family antitoxin [Peptococcaceae bacterium]
MQQINIHEAKTQLSYWLDRAAKGEPFIIAKAGKPIARVEAVERVNTYARVGFMRGHIRVPDDFDRMGADDITRLFGGSE